MSHECVFFFGRYFAQDEEAKRKDERPDAAFQVRPTHKTHSHTSIPAREGQEGLERERKTNSVTSNFFSFEF